MKATVEFESVEELAEFLSWRASRPQPPEQKPPEKTPLDRSGLSCRVINVLRWQFEFVEDALAMSDNELLRMPNFGKESLKAIRAWTRPHAAMAAS